MTVLKKNIEVRNQFSKSKYQLPHTHMMQNLIARRKFRKFMQIPETFCPEPIKKETKPPAYQKPILMAFDRNDRTVFSNSEYEKGLGKPKEDKVNLDLA